MKDQQQPDEPIRTANPRASYLEHRAEIEGAIQSVLDDGQYVLGPVAEALEAALARSVGTDHAVGVNSCTDAIHLTLRALGIGPGDEVITASHTAVATVAAIEMSGAAPVMVDVELPWMTIDPAAVAEAVGPRAKAVIAVHLYGQPADLDKLEELCDQRGIALIEDCAQAQGASWGEAPVGSFGAAACFSFYPTKNLGTVGDGGMIATDDEDLAQRARLLRQYGWDHARSSQMAGWNSRLGTIEAAVLAAKLPHLPEMIRGRRELAARYREGLAGLGLTLPEDRPGSTHANHLYVVRCEGLDKREALLRHLAAEGVEAGVHYPVPVHLQPAYRDRLRVGDLANTEAIARQVLSLPTYPELAAAGQDQVISSVRAFFEAEA